MEVPNDWSQVVFKSAGLAQIFATRSHGYRDSRQSSGRLAKGTAGTALDPGRLNASRIIGGS